MQQLGFFLILMGAGSFVLNLINMEFRLLSWIDTWGTTTGMIIKIALVVVGAVLVFMASQQSEEE